jgi:monoamine oxidase
VAPVLQTINLHNTASAYYAPGVVTATGKLLHVSGQSGTNVQGQAPSDYQSQIYLAIINLHRVIAAAGATPRDIVKLKLYIVDYNPKKHLHTRPLQKLLGSHRPAITLVPVPKLAFEG